MNEAILKLEKLLQKTEVYLSSCSHDELTYKPSIRKWSKKEILGHLVDSAINNLQRFTEIQFEPKPFNKYRKYNQNELVKANDYQHAELIEILGFWVSINKRIIKIMNVQTEETLRFELFIDGELTDLRYIMTDYVEHMEHHVKQIMG